MSNNIEATKTKLICFYKFESFKMDISLTLTHDDTQMQTSFISETFITKLL